VLFVGVDGVFWDAFWLCNLGTCEYLHGSLGGTLEPMASDGDFGNGLAKAESVFLWLGVPFAREGDVLVVDSDNVHLRIGYYDEHFLVNIGVHTHSGAVSWVGFDPLREDELLEFLRNALPHDITSSS
jgi:hypothetical protein